MNTETVIILVVVGFGGFLLWQSQQRAAQLQQAQLAAMAAQQNEPGGFFGTIGALADDVGSIFGVDLPSIGS